MPGPPSLVVEQDQQQVFLAWGSEWIRLGAVGSAAWSGFPGR